MDYKEKYEQAINFIKDLYPHTSDYVKEKLDDFFPELKESEDERIRKAIHIYLDWLDGHKDYQPKGNYTIKDMIAWLEKQGEERKITHEEICKSYGIPDIGEFSDGYHTFNGLYKQRMILFAVLVKTYKDRAWKSWKHEDGLDCFGGGWFIVGIDTPAGTYTYHYEAKDWDRFDCRILEKAKHWDGHDESDVERLFSLVSNANKDEVIRCLINGMKFYYEDNEEATWGTDKFSMKVKDILAWLEKQNSNVDNANKEYWRGYREGKQEILDKYAELKKQDEQKASYTTIAETGNGGINALVTRELSTNNYEEKPADRVEPKFNVGDWVVYYRNDSSREVLQVYDIRDGRYYFTDNVHFSWSVKECDEKCHLWTIQDAKDGDVLAEDTCIFMIKKLNPDHSAKTYCCLHDDGDFAIISTLVFDNTSIYPATEEQRDLLFTKMKEAGLLEYKKL